MRVLNAETKRQIRITEIRGMLLRGATATEAFARARRYGVTPSVASSYVQAAIAQIRSKAK